MQNYISVNKKYPKFNETIKKNLKDLIIALYPEI